MTLIFWRNFFSFFFGGFGSFWVFFLSRTNNSSIHHNIFIITTKKYIPCLTLVNMNLNVLTKFNPSFQTVKQLFPIFRHSLHFIRYESNQFCDGDFASVFSHSKSQRFDEMKKEIHSFFDKAISQLKERRFDSLIELAYARIELGISNLTSPPPSSLPPSSSYVLNLTSSFDMCDSVPKFCGYVFWWNISYKKYV